MTDHEQYEYRVVPYQGPPKKNLDDLIDHMFGKDEPRPEWFRDVIWSSGAYYVLAAPGTTRRKRRASRARIPRTWRGHRVYVIEDDRPPPTTSAVEYTVG